MLLNYRQKNWWKPFLTKHWKAQVPTVIRQPLRQFPFHDESLIRALGTFQKSLGSKQSQFRYLMNVAGKEGTFRSELKALLKTPCPSIGDFEKRIEKRFPKKEFGLMVNNLQSADPELWEGFTSFLQDAYPYIGRPIAKCVVDLFFGNYTSSFLGLHKDIQEIFAFVVRGEKTLLAWPFDYFIDRIKGLSPGAKFFQMQLPIDYRKYRKDAIVLHAKAGDVIYWPSSYWHIAESNERKFSTMLSLGIFLPQVGDTNRVFTLPQSRAVAFEELVDDEDLNFATGFNFGFEGPKYPAKISSKKIMKKPSTLLLWTMDSRRNLIVSVNGHSRRLRHTKQIETLLEKLAANKSVMVSPSDKGIVEWLHRVGAISSVA